MVSKAPPLDSHEHRQVWDTGLPAIVAIVHWKERASGICRSGPSTTKGQVLLLFLPFVFCMGRAAQDTIGRVARYGAPRPIRDAQDATDRTLRTIRDAQDATGGAGCYGALRTVRALWDAPNTTGRSGCDGSSRTHRTPRDAQGTTGRSGRYGRLRTLRKLTDV